MALVVEDGSVTPGADSYVSLANARALAASYGLALPADDTEAEAALRNGAVYVGLQEPSMCGRRVSASQSLAYPITAQGRPAKTEAASLYSMQKRRASFSPQAPNPTRNSTLSPTCLIRQPGGSPITICCTPSITVYRSLLKRTFFIPAGVIVCI